MIRQTLKILLNDKITRFTPLKAKHRWDIMLKMVFRRHLLYFASLIMFRDGLYLENDFLTKFLSFHYFYCCYCCLFVLLLLFLVLLFLLLYYFLLRLFFYIYSLNLLLFYLAMLGTVFLLYCYSAALLFMFIVYAYHFRFLLWSAILVLRSL